MIEAVFFDLDNVVYNTFEQSKECRICAIDDMIRTMHHIKIDSDKIPAIEKACADLMDIIKETGSNAKNHFDLLLNRYSIGGNKHVLIREAGINAYHKTKSNRVKPRPDVETTLKQLEKQYVLGIITNGKADKQLSKIQMLGLEKYFDIDNIIISEDIGYSKPSKEVYLAAAERINKNPEKCLHIDDNDVHVLGAYDAGFVPILYKITLFDKEKSCLEKLEQNKDYYVIEKISELIDLVHRLNEG